jgi:DNA processing protein
MAKSIEGMVAWIALKMIPNLGNITYKRLLERFGDPGAVFGAAFNELIEVEGVRVETARRILSKSWDGDPKDEFERTKKCGVRLIRIFDPSYPKDLREIHDPPPLLYVKGNDIPINQAIVAVIGSRNPSHYGLKVTEEICRGLAKRNVVVASGMAKGIDSAAHWGCLRGKGFTVAVLGSGIDVVYPESNSTLYGHITRKGSVVTEFPLGAPPEAKNFPIRNRVISGLSKGVVVVEASRRSGSLITATLALEQGREVFAVPGSVESFKSMGTHFLIKQGARLVENADDILQELGIHHHGPKEAFFGSNRVLPFMNENEKTIYGLLGPYPLHIDQIARNSEMDLAKVASLLTELELKGVVRQLPGKMFVR